MALDLRARLDAETAERIKPLRDKFNNGESFDVGDIFSAPAVPDGLCKESVFLHGADGARLSMSIPFYETVFSAVCPQCSPLTDRKSLVPLLETEGVIPVLIAPYSAYDEAFVRDIIKLPHISQREFRFFRNISIVLQSESQVCEHCVDKFRAELSEKMGRSDDAAQIVDEFFWMLAPFVEPDFELISQFGSALEKADLHRILQILELARVLHTVRTSQAYDTAQTVPFDRLQSLPNIDAVAAQFDVASAGELRRIAADELGLLIPEGMPAERYLEIVLPYRKQLTRLVGEIVENGDGNTAKLVATIGQINDEIRSVQGSKRFLAYRAIAGFAAGNSSIIGSLLVAGAMGLGGHLIGCGVSVAAGVGLKFASKLKPVKGNRQLRDFGRAVHASVQPAVASVLSRYIGISTRAVEVWQLRQELVGEQPEKPPTAAKPSRKRSPTRKTRGSQA